MNFELLAYNEGRFIVSSNANDFQSNKKQTINVIINPYLLYRDNTSLVGTTFAITIGEEKSPWLNYDFTLTYWIDGFEEFIKEGHSDKEIIEFTKKVWPDVIGFARGAMAVKCSSTPLSGIFLPNISLEEFIQKISIHKE